MPIYRIADLNVEVNPKFKICRKRLESYAVKSNESGKTDIAISVSDDEIRERLRLSDNLSEQGAEDVLILSKFCNAVLDGFDGFFFHSSCLELDGEGYVFSAVSGTGKSTHTALWRRHFGNRVTMINDDKPVIRKCDGKFYVYGTPWMGKADIGIPDILCTLPDILGGLVGTAARHHGGGGKQYTTTPKQMGHHALLLLNSGPWLPRVRPGLPAY